MWDKPVALDTAFIVLNNISYLNSTLCIQTMLTRWQTSHKSPQRWILVYVVNEEIESIPVEIVWTMRGSSIYNLKYCLSWLPNTFFMTLPCLAAL